MENSGTAELAVDGLAGRSMDGIEAVAAARADPAVLVPFVPRLVIDWIRESPEEPHRAVDGTIAFVDISGFTSMTERLARKGKVGAEEMHEILDGLFTDLLAVAYDDGAGLVKWGGDAVLLLFDGPNHAARACRAALNMQRTIRRIGHLQTSVGRATLRMSVGIHSGAFDFFLLGDPTIHRELVMAGPAVTETVRMEQIAEAGEVAVSAATAAAVDPTLLGPAKDAATLLRRAPQVPFLSARPGPNTAGVDLATLVPVAVREYLTQPREGFAEHRRITAAFLEFVGSDDLYAREGASALGRVIDECLRVVQREALRHEVAFFETDVGRNAWRVMLIAGAPTSPGEDEDRMLGAMRAVIEADMPFPVRIGTNAGHVFAGYFGPKFRKTYSVKGDAVNLAARVMAKAEPGQLLATASVLDPASALYTVTALEPFAAKGKRRPVQAWSVGRRYGSKAEQAQLPFAGREREVACLREALAEARAGRGSAVEIVGPAGIGKTRLLQQLPENAPDLLSLRALCEPYHRQVPYRPFRAILRTALDVPKRASAEESGRLLAKRVEELDASLLPLLPLLAAVVDAEVPMTREVADLGEDFRSAKVQEATLQLMRALFPTPTVLSFEDAHWMDGASSALLERLTREVGQAPWVVAVTRRDETTGFVLPEAERCVTLPLEPLSPSETEHLIVAATEAQPLRIHEIASLATRSAGNPLFLGQLLSAAQRAGSAEDLPLTVESLVTAQIDQLSAFERSVLRHASVLGAAFSESMVARLMDEGSIDAAVWTRLGQFLDGDGPGRQRYRHALMRHAAYEGLPYRRRRELHAKAGILLLAEPGDPSDRAELLSLHFMEAGDAAAAWSYSRMAADRALSRYANVEAAAFLERSLRSGRRAGVDSRDLLPLHRKLGDVYLLLNDFTSARTAYAEGRRLTKDDPLVVADFLYCEARVHYRAARVSDAVRSLRRGMRLAGEVAGQDARRVLARLEAFYAGMRFTQGRYAEAERLSRHLIDTAGEIGEPSALARAYYVLDAVLMDSGRVGEAGYSQKAVEIYDQLGELSFEAEVIFNMGADAYYAGDWNRAIELYDRSRELRERLGDEGESTMCTASVAEILLDQGRIEEGEALLADALRAARAGGYQITLAFVLELLGRAGAARGDFAESEGRLREARSVYGRVGYRSQVLEIDARLAEAHLSMGDPGRALADVDDALKRAADLPGTPQQLAPLLRTRGRALVATGRPDDARTAFEESLAAARSRGADREAALTLEALASLPEP